MSASETSGEKNPTRAEAAKTSEVEPRGLRWLRLLGYSDCYNEDGKWLGDLVLTYPDTRTQDGRTVQHPRAGDPILHPDTKEPLTAKEFDIACPKPEHLEPTFKMLEMLPEGHPTRAVYLEKGQNSFNIFCPIPPDYIARPEFVPPAQQVS